MTRKPSSTATAATKTKKRTLDILEYPGYQLILDFLMYSPSYHLAHQIALGELDKEKCVLPTDFDVVEATYAAFGNLYPRIPIMWWLRTAQHQFGLADTPQAKSLMRINRREDVTQAMMEGALSELNKFVLNDRVTQGNPATLVLAIPLQNDRKAMLKQVAQLIDDEFGKEREQRGIAPYQIIRNKIRAQTLKMAQAVSLYRSMFPELKLFEVGNLAGVSPANWSDPELKRNKVEANKRENMEILTSRHLHRAYVLAENAARGKFFSFEPLPDDPGRPKFDYIDLGSRLLATIEFRRREQKRIKEAIAKGIDLADLGIKLDAT